MAISEALGHPVPFARGDLRSCEAGLLTPGADSESTQMEDAELQARVEAAMAIVLVLELGIIR